MARLCSGGDEVGGIAKQPAAMQIVCAHARAARAVAQPAWDQRWAGAHRQQRTSCRPPLTRLPPVLPSFLPDLRSCPPPSTTYLPPSHTHTLVLSPAVDYVAMTPNGRVFDSSLEKGYPYQIRVGAGQVGRKSGRRQGGGKAVEGRWQGVQASLLASNERACANGVAAGLSLLPLSHPPAHTWPWI